MVHVMLIKVVSITHTAVLLTLDPWVALTSHINKLCLCACTSHSRLSCLGQTMLAMDVFSYKSCLHLGACIFANF